MSYADVSPPIGFLSEGSADPRTILFVDSLKDLDGVEVQPGQHVLVLADPEHEKNTIKVLLRGGSAAGVAGGKLPRAVYCSRSKYEEMKDGAPVKPPTGFGKRKFSQPQQVPEITFSTPAMLVQTALVGPAGNIRPDTNTKPKYVLSFSPKPWCGSLARAAAARGLDTTIDFADFAAAVDRLEDWAVYAMMSAYTRGGFAVAAAGRIAETIKGYVREFAKLKPATGPMFTAEGTIAPGYDEQLADVAHWLFDPAAYLRSTKSYDGDIAKCKALNTSFRASGDAAAVFAADVPAFIIRASIDLLRRDTSRIFHGLLVPPDDKNPTRSILMTRLLFQGCENQSVYETKLDEFVQGIDAQVQRAARVSPQYASFISDQLQLVKEIYSSARATYFESPKITRVARLPTGGNTHVAAAPPMRNSVAVGRFKLNASSVGGRCDIGMQPVSLTTAYPSSVIDPEYHVNFDNARSSGSRLQDSESAMFDGVDLSDTFGADEAAAPPPPQRRRLNDSRSQFDREIEADVVEGASYQPAASGGRGKWIIPMEE